MSSSLLPNKASLKQKINVAMLSFQVVLQGSDEIAARAIELIKETYTNLGPRLRASQVQFMQFLQEKLR